MGKGVLDADKRINKRHWEKVLPDPEVRGRAAQHRATHGPEQTWDAAEARARTKKPSKAAKSRAAGRREAGMSDYDDTPYER